MASFRHRPLSRGQRTVEHPPDVGGTVREHIDRFPPAWRAAAERIEGWSRELAELRSLAFYGDEETGRPASELFDREDADAAVSALDELLALYRGLMEDPTG